MNSRLYTMLKWLPCLIILVACQPSSTPANREAAKEYMELFDAKNFSIEIQGDLKILRIGQAWPGAKERFTYVLYPKESKPPSGFSDAIKIPVPVERILCTGTTQLAMLDELDALDKMVAVTNGQYIYNPKIHEAIASGSLVDLGNAQQLNYEKALEVQPDLVLSFSIGKDQSYKKFESLGVPTLLCAEFMEDSPLGRAEWIRLLGAVLGKEELALQQYQQLSENYHQLKKQMQQVSARPTVFTGVAQQGAWYVAGGKSFMASLIQDAGGEYLWRNGAERGGLPLDFEAVVQKAVHADLWLNVVLAGSLKELKAMDHRYTLFDAFQQQQVYSYTARVSENGGYDFFESAIVRPDLVLADLAVILHPELFPNRELFYYQQLK